LGTYRPDYWVSDRLASQMHWAKKDHQVCLAHLIRDATYYYCVISWLAPPAEPQRHSRGSGAGVRRWRQ
jgi:hypothetical protein